MIARAPTSLLRSCRFSGVIRSEGTDLQPVAGIPPGTGSPISSPVEFANASGESHALAIPVAPSIEDFGTNLMPALPIDMPFNLHADPARFSIPGQN